MLAQQERGMRHNIALIALGSWGGIYLLAPSAIADADMLPYIYAIGFLILGLICLPLRRLCFPQQSVPAVLLAALALAMLASLLANATEPYAPRIALLTV